LGGSFNGTASKSSRRRTPDLVDLVFADPPFNLGKIYGPHFEDKALPEDYLE